MNKLEELTIERLHDERPDLHKAIFDTGAKSERDRFVELQRTCGDNLALVAECFVTGRESPEAVRLQIHQLKSLNRKLRNDPVKLAHEYATDPAVRDRFSSADA